MKKIITSLFFAFAFIFSVIACFIDDPNANTGNHNVTLTLDDSVISVNVTEINWFPTETIIYPYWIEIINGIEYKYEITVAGSSINRKTYTKTSGKWNLTNTQTFDSKTHGIWNNQIYEIHANVTTPFTYEVEFSGFENYESDKITRMCLLYLNKDGKFKILKDIKNPNFNVASNTGEKRALFGKYSVYGTFGYKRAEILAIVAYFETATKSTHNLNTLLNTKYTNLNDIPGLLKLGVYPNKNPL